MTSRSFLVAVVGVLTASAAGSAALLDTHLFAHQAADPPAARAAQSAAVQDPSPTAAPPRRDLDEVLRDVESAVEAAVDAEAIARQVEAAVDEDEIARHVQSALAAVEVPMIAMGRARLGIGVRDLSADEANTAGLPDITGAQVTSVAEDSVAARAGLSGGDVVLRVDGQDVRSARHLTRLIDETPAGRAIVIEYLRNGTRTQANVTLEPAPGMRDMLRGRTSAPFAYRMADPLSRGRTRGRLGIGVQDLSPQLARYFGAREGVLVTEVNDGSPAARAGLRAGDVITKVHDTTVTRVGDISRALANVDGGTTVPVEIIRDKAPQALEVTLDTRPTGSPAPVGPRPRVSAD